jgi:hypothetical protein
MGEKQGNIQDENKVRSQDGKCTLEEEVAAPKATA